MRARHLAPVLASILALATLGQARADEDHHHHTTDGNPSDWVGRPTFIGGTSVVDEGEFIYSDYVHDDHGANSDGLYSGSLDPGNPVTGIYPNLKDPANVRNGATGNNIGSRLRFTGDYSYPTNGQAGPTDVVSYNDVADLLEFRVAVDGDMLHYLIKLGALVNADDAVVGIGIDTDRDHTTGMGEWPLGARLPAQLGYEFFVTLWGSGGEITDGAATSPVTVVANMDANVIEVSLPMPAPRGTWRHYVGTGVWDGDSWMEVEPSTTWGGTPGALGTYPNIFDLAFVPFEWNSWWRDDVQADDLAARDIAQDHADIDMRDLANEKDGHRPRPTGLLNVQYPALPLGPGEGNLGELSVFASTNYVYQGTTQPYTLFLPSHYDEDDPSRFMYFFHCLNCNHNIWPLGVEDASTRQRNHIVDGRLGTNNIQAIADEFDLAVAGSLQRGEGGPADYGTSVGERDLIDVWNTIRGGRDGYRFDQNRSYFAGMSMGGSTTNRMMTLYPDEIAAAVAYSSPANPARLRNMRNVPWITVMGDTGLDIGAINSGRAGAAAMRDMGYRHFNVEYIGRAHDFNLVYESWPMVKALLADDVRDENPPRVTYQLDASTEAPQYGLAHDDAYWISGLTLNAGAASGTVDATSWAIADELPAMTSHLQGHFLNLMTGNQAFVSWMEWDRDLTGLGLQTFETGWQPLPDVTITNTPLAQHPREGDNGFEATLASFAASTFDLERMGIDPNAVLTAAISTDATIEITLLADWSGAMSVTVDGQPVSTTQSADELTFTLQPGSHEVVVS